MTRAEAFEGLFGDSPEQANMDCVETLMSTGGITPEEDDGVPDEVMSRIDAFAAEPLLTAGSEPHEGRRALLKELAEKIRTQQAQPQKDPVEAQAEPEEAMIAGGGMARPVAAARPVEAAAPPTAADPPARQNAGQPPPGGAAPSQPDPPPTPARAVEDHSGRIAAEVAKGLAARVEEESKPADVAPPQVVQPTRAPGPRRRVISEEELKERAAAPHGHGEHDHERAGSPATAQKLPWPVTLFCVAAAIAVLVGTCAGAFHLVASVL